MSVCEIQHNRKFWNWLQEPFEDIKSGSQWKNQFMVAKVYKTNKQRWLKTKATRVHEVEKREFGQ